MKQFVLIIVAIITMFIMSSCLFVPSTSEVAPPVKGRVTDAKNNVPIANAQLTYSRANYSAVTTSKENGTFTIGSLTQWHYIVFIGSPGFFPVPVNLGLTMTPANLTIIAPGYHAKNISICCKEGYMQRDGSLKQPQADYKYDEDIIVKLNSIQN